MTAARRRPYRLAGTTTKALPTALTSNAAGRIQTAEQVTALAQLQNQMGTTATPLPRDLFPYQFGPGIPLDPAPLDPVRRDSGRAEPRIYDYPVSWNLPGQQGRLIPFSVLRRAAEMPILSDCIRIRKEEISTLEWEIGVSPRAVGAVQRDQPGTSRHTAEQSLRDTLIPQIEELTRFWQEPDRGNGYTFPQWITQLLDERLVLDAIAIYPRRTLGGDLYAFEILDGATIKPLLDHRGGRPMPPEPAYQQQLHGFPRGEFTADVTLNDDGQQIVSGGYPADQLIYLRREVRTWTPYGRSPVEMALLDLDTWMKRQGWIRAEYTDGVMPGGWLRWLEGNAGNPWTPQQVLEYETMLNDVLSGDTAARKRWRVLPPGMIPEPAGPGEAERYKPEYDLFLLKLLVAHFDMTISELGFTETQGLGSAGHAQAQEQLNDRKGSVPTLKALQAIITNISRTHLGMPGELEFRWTDLAGDDGDADTVVADQVAAGLLTLNEGRDETGRPRYDFPEADKAALYAPRTGSVTFLEGASIVEEPVNGAGVPPETGGGQAPADPAGQAGEEDEPAHDAAKVAEASAYRRWASKNRNGRRFALEHIASPSDLATYRIDPARVTLGKAAGDPTPERVAQWPGWSKDQEAATIWTSRIIDALAGLDVAALAHGWLASQTATKSATEPPPPPSGAAAATGGAAAAGGSAATTAATESAAATYVASQGINLTAELGTVFVGMSTDGYFIGDRAAQAMSTRTSVDWDTWEPGDDKAAARILGDDGRGSGLRKLLAEQKLTLEEIARVRVDRFVPILAEAVANGDSPDTLAKALREIVDDEEWAESVAITEIARAVSAATEDRYRSNHIMKSTWLTANDTVVCPVCIENEQEGPVALGTAFVGGAIRPPQHPRCRCTLLPSFEAFSPAQAGHVPDYKRPLGERADGT